MAKCKKCGSEVGDGSHVCMHCGEPLTSRFNRSNLFAFGFFLAMCAFFVGVPFALLRAGTSLPVWAVVVISIPAGAALFYIAWKWAEIG